MKNMLLVIVVLVLFFIPVNSKGTKVSKLVKNIENKLKTIKTFHVNFSQELINPNLDEREIKRGEIFYQKRPMRIKWEIKYPDPEVLYITEDHVLDYFPDEKLAYRYSFKQTLKSKILLRFISGNISFDNFVIEEIPSDDKKFPFKLKLIPKDPEPSLVLVYIWTDNDWVIKKMEFYDFFSNKNSIRFDKIDTNIKLNKELFELKLDKDVKVLESNLSN